MKAEDFDSRFDEGIEDIIEDLDLSTARRVNHEPRRTPPHQGAQRYPAEAAPSGLEEYKRSTRPRTP